MKLFECQHCGQLLYFENTRCERCRHVLGYLPDGTILSGLTAEGGDRWRPLAAPDEPFRFCANAVYDACNWLVPADGPEAFCRACRLNRTIPNLEAPENLLLWQRLEAAKHRLDYGLLRLGLPLVSKFEDAEKGLAFDFLAGSGAMFQEGPQVVTGHAQVSPTPQHRAWGDDLTPSVGIFRSQQMGTFQSQLTVIAALSERRGLALMPQSLSGSV